MNETLLRFGYPATLLREFEHWCILRRPAQVTLGALVLVSKHDATSLGALPKAAYTEMQICTSAIETALNRFRPFDKINYLALMMVDPQVHFHVLPRYAQVQNFEKVSFPDPGWPGVPDLKSFPMLDEPTQTKLHACLLDALAFVV